MNLTFWGTRASIPVPGKATVRYGGNTPCMEVRLKNDNLVIFDAGTGLRGLGDALMTGGESVKAVIVLSHPHWDHIQGFPFFKPPFISGNEFTIMGPQSKRVRLRRVMADLMDKSYFPIQLNELKAKIIFRPLREETVPVFDAILTSRSCWRQLTSTLGRKVEIILGNETLQGLAESITDEGMLIVRLPSGLSRIIQYGELTLLR